MMTKLFVAGKSEDFYPFISHTNTNITTKTSSIPSLYGLKKKVSNVKVFHFNQCKMTNLVLTFHEDIYGLLLILRREYPDLYFSIEENTKND